MSDISMLIVLLLALALLLRLDFIFYIVYVITGIFIWSHFVTPRAFRNLRFTRRFTDHAFLGERVTVCLELRNTGRLPLPWVQLTESVPPELAVGQAPSYAASLAARESVTYTYEVQATRRGYYRLGPLYLRSGDLFGWQEQNAESHLNYLTVYPRIIPLTQLGLPSRLPFGTIASQQRLFEDPARPVGVRDYRSGDSLRQINWKVTAHNNRLVVRTLQPAISLETAVLLNLNANDYERRSRYSAPEWAIEVCASLAAHLVDRKQAVGLMTNGSDPLRQKVHTGAETAGGLLFDDVSGRLRLNVRAGDATGAALVPGPIPPRGGRAHLMKVLELLARVEAADTVPFAGWIPRACLHLGWGVTIPAITPRADETLLQALHRLVRAGYNPILLLISRQRDFAEVKERARLLGFTAYEELERKDLELWQNRRAGAGTMGRYMARAETSGE